jgi:hypothetical protein
MNKLDIDEKTFYAYAVYTQQLRRYSVRWASVIFKVNFGEYPPKEMLETEAIKPSIPFINWLNRYEDESAIEYREKQKALKEKKTEMVATIAKAKQKNIEKGRKPKKAKPPKHDVERQMREVGEILASKGKDFSNVTQDELNRELRNWHINEHYKNKTAKMTEEEQLIDLLFTK